MFVPVTDFKQALGLLEIFNTVHAEDGVYKLTPKDGKKANYVKQQGAWAFLADKPEVLAQCTADPVAVLGNLEKNYIVAGHVFLANVPEGLREKFLGQVKQGIQKDAARHRDESSEEFANRKKIIDQVEPYLTRVFSELDQVVFGWGLDRAAGKTFVDVSVTAKPGTETAEEMGLAGKCMTNLAGFHVPGAAFTAAWAGRMPAAKQAIAASVIAAARSKGLSDIEKKSPEDKRALGKEVLNGGADVLQKIVKSGHVDGAAAVLIGPKAATALLAGYVADGGLLDNILHVVAKAVFADHPELEQFVTLDAEKNGSINFHKISIPLPQDSGDAENVIKLVGEKLDIVIGLGKEYAYLAAGRDAMASLKKAIEGSASAGATSVVPLEVSLAVKPVVGLVAAVSKQAAQAAMAESVLKKTPGKDHISLCVRPISDGVQVRLEVEQGLIRLAGHLVVMGMEHKSATTPAAPE